MIPNDSVIELILYYNFLVENMSDCMLSCGFIVSSSVFQFYACVGRYLQSIMQVSKLSALTSQLLKMLHQLHWLYSTE
jgi:hypothetical protein